MPPQWYPTHSNAYYVGVTGGSFTEVSCMGMPSIIHWLQPENNRYQNPFGTEIALFRTSEGGMARMAVSWDTPGPSGEMGRVRGQKGIVLRQVRRRRGDRACRSPRRPPLPPGVEAGGHGGSHGQLMNEFVAAILEDRKPLVDIAQALNMTVAGIVAHTSALKNGETAEDPAVHVGLEGVRPLPARQRASMPQPAAIVIAYTFRRSRNAGPRKPFTRLPTPRVPPLRRGNWISAAGMCSITRWSLIQQLRPRRATSTLRVGCRQVPAGACHPCRQRWP